MRYQHYKGELYRVIQMGALLEATKEPCVVYRSEKDGQVWIRPVADFFAHVEGHGPRFSPAAPPRASIKPYPLGEVMASVVEILRAASGPLTVDEILEQLEAATGFGPARKNLQAYLSRSPVVESAGKGLYRAANQASDT